MITEETREVFCVLVNPQGRHAVWPARRAFPDGWNEALAARSREECLEYVRQHGAAPLAGQRRKAGPKVAFGLMFFGGGEHDAAREKYRLIIDCARFADEHGFSAVWLPERHFTQLGCLYPNPAVLHAALACQTSRIRLRAGSVVLPLHDPIRVAEEWAVVNNLSGGRVDLSFAAGWNPEDFALAPERYTDRHAAMFAAIPTVQRLWSGQTIAARGGDGKTFDLRIYPTPVQPRLPVWITAADSLATVRSAGALGANLLTHMFDMNIEKLAEMIAQYREARAQNGFDPATGNVTVALHTFLGDDIAVVREHTYKPYCDYLRSNVKLVEKLAASRGLKIEVASLTERQLDDAVDYLFEKFLNGRSLLGTPETCAELVGQLASRGVDEIACLLDFGPGPAAIVPSLESLRRLARRFA